MTVAVRVQVAPPPGDQEIRTALVDRIRHRAVGKAAPVVLHELGLCRGQVRVDVAVVKRVLCGYEIKSDRDSLRRLSGQVDFYGRVLDRASLIVGQKLASEAASLVPAWWELQVVQPTGRGFRLHRLRQGKRNPRRDARSLVELLWLEDALRLLDARGGTRGYRGRPRREIWDRVCELFTVDEIAEAVRSSLRARSIQQGPRRPA